MATVVAILLGSGVLLGTLAVVVDVGRLYVERDELQNGADSAALAMAKACADSTPECASAADLLSLAQRYADENAADRTSSVDIICGDVPGAFDVPSCGAQPENLTGCLGVAPDANYVEVHVSTRMADGETVLPPAFSQALAGGNSGTTVGACARATWGQLVVPAFTIDKCLYDALPHLPANSDVTDQDEVAIQFWQWEPSLNPPAPSGCGSGPTPNIAGVLDDPDGQCNIAIGADGQINGQFFEFVPGGRASDACVNVLAQARNDLQTAQQAHSTTRPVIYLPVYDSVQSSGEDSTFQEVLLAPFAVTAFQLGAPPKCLDAPDGPELCDYPLENYRKGSWVDDTSYWIDLSSLDSGKDSPGPCGTPEVGHRCLTGAFVGEPVPISSLTNSNASVRLVG